VPVVVSRTKIDQFYFNDSVVRFFTSGDIEALADGMLDVLRNPQLRDRLVTNALEYSDRNSWKSRKNDYLAIVDRLVSDADVARAN
jgi:glycosyltransferase involved in cell wall biosynthesis